MFVHLTASTNVSVQRNELRGVSCENCGCQYLYRLSRRIVQSYPVHTGSEEEAHRAARGVEKRIRKIAKRSVDAIPCPDCGYLQRAMVRSVKLEGLAWLLLIAMGVFFVLGCLAFLALVPDVVHLSIWVPIGIGILAMAGLIAQGSG